MVEQQAEFDIKRIAGTLKYGWFDGEKKKYVIPLFVVFTLIFVGVGLGVGLTLIIMDIKSDGAAEFTDVLAIIGCLFVAVVPPLILGLLIRRNEKCRKEIELWLADAVELTAYVREIGAIKSNMTAANNTYKIRVEFKYDGHNYNCESNGKPFGATESHCGYHNVWKDYINRKVNILYSPKYREVMVLKDR